MMHSSGHICQHSGDTEGWHLPFKHNHIMLKNEWQHAPAMAQEDICREPYWISYFSFSACVGLSPKLQSSPKDSGIILKSHVAFLTLSSFKTSPQALCTMVRYALSRMCSFQIMNIHAWASFHFSETTENETGKFSSFWCIQRVWYLSI